MDEHEDDLESEVQEGAEMETDHYPDTGDELEDQGLDDDQAMDDDEAEL